MSTEDHSMHRNILLWIALLGPALAWFIQLTASYTIAAYACANDRMWILHTISIAALALAGAGVWCGWRNWRLQRSRRDDAGREGEFLAVGIWFLGMLFFLTILVGELSNWLLDPCI